MLWFAQLCLALDHLHSKKILHRDLKTMNVFLTANNIVKLGDFGFSKRLKTAAMAHTVCGTPYYFSPELCQGFAYSNRSDIWSLGIILYEMAMLRRPYEATTMQDLMKKIVYGNFSPLTPNVPHTTAVLIEAMLAKDSTQRPSITDLLLHSEVQPYVEKTVALLRVASPQNRYPTDVVEEPSEDASPVNASPMKESQAVTAQEMQALKSQMETMPPPEDIVDDYESDFEEFDDHADAPLTGQEGRRAKLVGALGEAKMKRAAHVVHEVMVKEGEAASHAALQQLLSEAEMKLVPLLTEYVICDMKDSIHS
eukprot:NODE_2900_length_1067_cov_30.237234_g2766_i0.p1 GENE.NODE_2900_length_1067_cov_30.237234_g2766_i0~~NODE_2900_length_1067_cov_30.237234_g2766_i0.p1  ORF type:complete len:334 (+),score=109.26 NODE_2900_length_1067_cov_30.237234_g2766_i0:74-1003(+)